MFDAFYIYSHYQRRNTDLSQYVLCGEAIDLLTLDIHGQQNFVPVEFAGVVTTVLFYVSMPLM